MPLYHSPIGLYPFQIEAVTHCYYRRDNLCVYDTGIGKGHIAMATAALLLEDGLIDIVFIICEENKVGEWIEDFAKFCPDISTRRYRGSVPQRNKMRDDITATQVIVSTYETVRNDSLVKGKSGPLNVVMKSLRVLYVYDEAAKLRNRNSGLHKAHKQLISDTRKHGESRILGLTATPIEKGPEDYYNLGRIWIPDAMPTVEYFNTNYVARWDIFNNPKEFKNLDEEHCDDDVTPFNTYLAPVLLRKRKTDPDVIDQFPKKIEESTHVNLHPLHMDLYETVREHLSEGLDERSERNLFGVLRLLAAHPLSLTRSEGKMAVEVCHELGGYDVLKNVPSYKTEAIVRWARMIKDQGDLSIIFTFYANAVLPLIAEALLQDGIRVAINAPFVDAEEREVNRKLFRDGKFDVFLSSDAGSQGLNLPEATYLSHYELPMTHGRYDQRSNRHHRIDSDAISVSVMSWIARDTVEEGIANLMLKRNQYSNTLLDDDDPGDNFITAEMRREMLAIKRKSKR